MKQLMMPATLLCTVALLAAGCGESEEGSAHITTASTSTGATGAGGPQSAPGAPDPGEPSYNALGSYWKQLTGGERLDSAQDYIDAHPADCAGVAAEDLARQTLVAYSIDFPLTTTAAEVMLETCDLLQH